MKTERIVILAALAALAGCSWDHPVTPEVREPAKKVFLMYDNIGDWFEYDVREAGRAVAAGALAPDERVVVFHRNYASSSGGKSTSTIYELVKDSKASGGYTRNDLKKYADGENESLSKETIAGVVGDVRDLFPEAEGWGLAFGSHGLGWIPASNAVEIARSVGTWGEPSAHPFAELWAERENPLTRYLASEKRERIDLGEFADALDGEQGDQWKWDFIIFDDCFMASVEAMYEMRRLATTFIASPTEIMSSGFPYDRVVNTIFDDWTDVVGVGEVFIDRYKNIGGEYPCGTIAVVNTAGLEPLAEKVRNLNLNLNELTSVEGIQYYEGISSPGHIFYDLDDYLSEIRVRKGLMVAEYNEFKTQLDLTVLYAGHTDRFYSDYGGGAFIPVSENYSGLNVFIPWSRTEVLVPLYRQTEWYKAVYAE